MLDSATASFRRPTAAVLTVPSPTPASPSTSSGPVRCSSLGAMGVAAGVEGRGACASCHLHIEIKRWHACRRWPLCAEQPPAASHPGLSNHRRQSFCCVAVAICNACAPFWQAPITIRQQGLLHVLNRADLRLQSKHLRTYIQWLACTMLSSVLPPGFHGLVVGVGL